MTTKAETAGERAQAQAQEARPKRSGKAADKSDILEGSRYWTEYRNVDFIRAEQIEEDFTVTDADGTAHTGKEGDYIAVSRKGEVRVIAAEDFHAHFKPLAPAKE